jgi:hypothetical protein
VFTFPRHRDICVCCSSHKFLLSATLRPVVCSCRVVHLQRSQSPVICCENGAQEMLQETPNLVSLLLETQDAPCSRMFQPAWRVESQTDGSGSSRTSSRRAGVKPNTELPRSVTRVQYCAIHSCCSGAFPSESHCTTATGVFALTPRVYQFLVTIREKPSSSWWKARSALSSRSRFP